MVDVMLFAFSPMYYVIAVGSQSSSFRRDPLESNSDTNVYVLRPEVLSRQARTDEIPVDEVSNHNLPLFVLF